MDRAGARELLGRLCCDAERIARQFGLRYHSIEAEHPNVTSRYGICDSDGRIRIRLRHATTGRPLRYSSLVSTLCHELAHLRHMNHGARFQAFYRKILEWARSEGLYRPHGKEDGSALPAPPAPQAIPRRAVLAPVPPPGGPRKPVPAAPSRVSPAQLSLF